MFNHLSRYTQTTTNLEELTGGSVQMKFELFNAAIILFLAAGIIFAAVPLIVSRFVSPRSKSPNLQLPYECGIVPHGSPRVRFGVNYYFYALLFIAFDVDVLYLFPVAVSYASIEGWAVFWEVFLFVAILVMAIIYFWKKGVFTWPRKINY
jgi:NADH-quinone oxidoreductase subunit A